MKGKINAVVNWRNRSWRAPWGGICTCSTVSQAKSPSSDPATMQTLLKVPHWVHSIVCVDQRRNIYRGELAKQMPWLGLSRISRFGHLHLAWCIFLLHFDQMWQFRSQSFLSGTVLFLDGHHWYQSHPLVFVFLVNAKRSYLNDYEKDVALFRDRVHEREWISIQRRPRSAHKTRVIKRLLKVWVWVWSFNS